MAIKYHSNIRLMDNNVLQIGTGGDLKLEHTGAHSNIYNTTGDLSFINYADDKDIIFKSDDGSGGTTTYFYLDGSIVENRFAKATRHSDSIIAKFGDGNDLNIYSDGTNGIISVETDDADLIFKCDDGSGGTTAYLTLDGSAETTIFSKQTTFNNTVVLGSQLLKFADNGKAYFGDSNDLQIYHDGTDSRIENSTGDLQIQNFADDKDIKFLCDDGSGGTETYFMLDGSNNFMRSLKHIRFDDNASVLVGSSSDLSITHNGTNSVIANSTGDLQINQNADDGDLIFQCDDGSGGTTEYFKLDGGAVAMVASKSIYMADSKRFYAGGGGDLAIYHDGSNTNIENITGNLNFYQKADDQDIIFLCDDGSGGNATYFQLDGSEELNRFYKNVLHQDNVKGMYGTSLDLQIYHDGTNSYIHNDTGDLRIENDNTDGDIIFRSDNGSGGLSTYFRVDGGLQKTIFPDNQTLGIGSSGDLNLIHDGSNSYIHHNGTGSLYMKADTGNIQIINYTNDADIVLQSDDGSGGVTPYITLDGSTKRVNVPVQMGINAPTTYTAEAAADDLIIGSGSGEVGITIYSGSSNHGSIFFADDLDEEGAGDSPVGARHGKIMYGQDTSDFEFRTGGNQHAATIAHDGSTFAGSLTIPEYINHTGDGNTSFGFATDDTFRVTTGGTQRLNIATGIELTGNTTLTGTLTVGVDDTGHDVKFFGATSGSYVLWDESDDALELVNSTLSITGGNSGQLTITSGNVAHDASIDLDTGDSNGQWRIKVEGSDETFRISNVDQGGTAPLTIHPTTKTITLGGPLTVGADDTGHDVIFYGATSGRYLQWDESADKLLLRDSTNLVIGNGSDLQLYHNGSTSFIYNNTGDLQIVNSADDSDILFRCDDGSGGLATYFSLDGSAGYTTVQKQIRLEDSVEFRLGDSGDAYAVHNGSNFFLVNDTGDLTIKNSANDKDIIFQCDDHSGGTATYFFLDGSTTSELTTTFPDNSMAAFGTGNDLRLWHDGSTSYVNNYNGTFKFYQHVDDGDMIFYCDDGSGGATPYITLDGGDTNIKVSKPMQFGSSVRAYFGSSNHSEILHNGTDMSINNFVGDLKIINYTDDKDIIFQSDDGSGGVETYFFLDGSVNSTVFPDSSKLYFGTSHDSYIEHDGTNTYLSNATGKLIIRNTLDDGDIELVCDDGSGGNAAYITLDGSDTAIKIGKELQINGDSRKLKLGASGDLEIFHNGTDSSINNATGHLYIKNEADDKDIIFQSDDGSGGVETYFFLDGSASSGNPITIFPDLSALYFGTGTDLLIRHDGTDSTIANNGGDFYITQNTNDKDIFFQCDDGAGGAITYFRLDGSLATHDGSSTTATYTKWGDNDIVALGDGADARLYHNGTDTYLDNLTGDYIIRQKANDKDLILECDDGSGGDTPYITLDGSLGFTTIQKHVRWQDGIIARFGNSDDGSLYHSGAHFYVGNNTGNIIITNTTDDGDIIFNSDDGSGGTETYFFLDGSTSRTVFPDAKYLVFGTDHNLFIAHDGSHSYIQNYTSGDFYIDQRVDDKDLVFRADDGAGGTATYFRLDGSAATHNGSATTFMYTQWLDNSVISLGSAKDFNMRHNGSNTILDNTTGDLEIRNSANDADVILKCDDGSGGVTSYITLDGSVTKTILNKPSQRTFEVSDASTHGDANGDIVYFGGTTSMSAGKIYHYKANGTWELADADAASTSDGLLAVAIGAASDTNGMLLRGMITLDHDPGNLGDVLFLSTTAGEATGTAPSGSGDIVRVVGYLLGGAHGQIYFNPDGAFVEVA